MAVRDFLDRFRPAAGGGVPANLAAEIIATRHRVRALQRQWIPARETALARTELAEPLRDRRALSTPE